MLADNWQARICTPQSHPDYRTPECWPLLRQVMLDGPLKSHYIKMNTTGKRSCIVAAWKPAHVSPDDMARRNTLRYCVYFT